MATASTSYPEILRGGAAIIGVGHTRYSRNSGMPTTALLLEAVKEAAADAGISPSEIDGSIMADPRLPLKPEILEMNLGLKARRFSAMGPTAGGAGVGWSLMMAALAVSVGWANTIVCFMGRNSASEPALWSPRKWHADDEYKRTFELPYGWFPQPVYFATMARRHMAEYGTTIEQLGSVAVACRKHAQMNDNAIMFGKPMTMQQYLDSRIVAEPLHVTDCALIQDGAAAVIVTSRERARSARKPPVSILAAQEGHIVNAYYFAQSPDFVGCAAKETRDVFPMAGVTHSDIDIAMVYDCFTISVLMQLEDLGFCKKGEAGAFADGGRLELGGELPLNTAGGLLSEAHIAGMNHVVEAVRQLRGECGARQVPEAKVALFSGFSDSDHVSVILGKE